MRRITVVSRRIRKYLHPDDGVDEEEHHDEQSYVRQSLRAEHRQGHALSGSGEHATKTRADDGRPEQQTWKDLMKVHSKFRIPSERFSSLTRRMTRKSRKKVMDTDAFSVS